MAAEIQQIARGRRAAHPDAVLGNESPSACSAPGTPPSQLDPSSDPAAAQQLILDVICRGGACCDHHDGADDPVGAGSPALEGEAVGPLQGRAAARLDAGRPAFIVMLAVTAYPILNALWLSLFGYRLTAPDDRRFVGLSNYWVVLSDSSGGRPCSPPPSSPW